MMISKELVEEIRSRNDIVELIGSYVNLKRAGSNFGGLCPYHSEKTPSFTVFPATQSFYCFGCGAGGDAITFVMKSENLDYPSAVEFLAKRAGITITVDDQRQDGISKRRILDMNLAAAKYFRACLFDPKLGKTGMDYLAGKRKLSPAIIKRFGLGFAPESFGALTDHMHKLGFSDEELIVGFLCGKSQKTGRAYDYFRNRVIFPIINTSGDVIAFGGRVMDDSKPKYLNSSDTPGFKKSRNLFALNYAKNHCSERMILCEGYMDVIALHSAGFENAVATLGTALTSEQARLMAKHTKQVIISYDSDEAGQAATRKAVRMLSDVGLDVRILRMEGAKDPDEYIKKFGADSFRKLLDASRTGFEFKLESTLQKYNLSISSDKLKASAEMCEYISEIWSEVERDVYISLVAARLSLPVEGLKNDVESMRRKKIKTYNAKTSQDARLGAMGVGDKINTDGIKNIKAKAAEEAVIGLMLMFEEYRDLVCMGKLALSGDDFSSDFHRRAFERIVALQADNQFDFSLLGEFFTPDEMGRLQGLEQKRRMLTENGKAVFEQCAETVKTEKQLSSGDDSGIDEIRRLLAHKRGENK
ncbi:MAG: DNA primase [Clostridia bacterium]|nr:DNA primase [Clostridia bacterium]